jgi:hypothetical protein
MKDNLMLRTDWLEADIPIMSRFQAIEIGQLFAGGIGLVEPSIVKRRYPNRLNQLFRHARLRPAVRLEPSSFTDFLLIGAAIGNIGGVAERKWPGAEPFTGKQEAWRRLP